MQNTLLCNISPTALFLLLLFISQANSGEEKLLSRKKRYVVFPEGSSFSIALCMTVHTLTPDNIFTEGLNWGISYDLPNESKPELEPLLHLRKDKVQLDKFWQPEDNNNYNKANYNYLQRRYRRDLYNKIEIIINAMGFHGRSCVLRALCEASQRFIPRGNSLIEEMIRIVFRSYGCRDNDSKESKLKILAISIKISEQISFEIVAILRNNLEFKTIANISRKTSFNDETLFKFVQPREHHTYSNAHKFGHEGRNCPAMFPECSFSLIDMALGKYKVQDDVETNNWSHLKYIM